MPSVHLICPHCRRDLLSQRLIAPGEFLRCPYCSRQFRAGMDEAPRSAAAPSQAAPRRGYGILLAWLLFANLLVLVGGGIAIAVYFGSRAQPQDSPQERPSVAAPTPVDMSVQYQPVETDPAPLPAPVVPTSAAPPSKPAPAPDPLPDLPADPPKPPPLPGLPPRPAEPRSAPKEKQPEPEKPHAETPNRREAPQANWLPTNIQKEVDGSIDRGIEFLRRRQHADGSWGHLTGKVGKRFTPGVTALSALTLLECGVPAKDSHVRLAARYLRQRLPELTCTYSIALAILFFDRLGDETDAARIRTLSLRLIAGQKTSGGWDYTCPTLNGDEELGLLALLYKDRPTTPLDLFVGERNKDALEGEPKREETKRDADLYRPRPSKAPPLELFVGQDPSTANLNPPAAAESAPFNREPKASGEIPPLDRAPKDSAKNAKRMADPALPGDRRRLSKRALQAADKLPESLRKTPALRAADLLRNPPDFGDSRTDNSNTQFAILGLLTAENYDVPMERAMALLDWRFRNSMTVQGGWNYLGHYPTLPAMTAAGLMGLALKHGLLLPNRRGRGRNVLVHDDEIIHRGFLTLTGLLENYFAGFVFNQTPLDKLDLYCLWTIERVAVLYNVRELGDLDWYSAAVQLLLPLQGEDGSWSPKGSHCLEEPSVSSSFALLFLKRSNLARGLTERLKVSDTGTERRP
ncbi:MAG: prenyltransferase/squalene oxidase repeat-containing protein [Gemmataceae bacterium]